MSESISHIDFSKEFWFNTSRSSGPGGQHVNKTNTRVELRFALWESYLLTDEQKHLIAKNLQHMLTNDGILIIVSQESRSQIQNRENCIKRFYEKINLALIKPKTRKATKPSQAAKRKRLDNKKKLAEKKMRRKPPEV